MAKIFIKGRREPIDIENARAVIIKNRKYGLNGEQARRPEDAVDLGDWCGEYGRIMEIELTVENQLSDTEQKAREKEEQKRQDEWLRMPPENKGRFIGKFRLAYQAALGDFKAGVPAEAEQLVVQLQTDFYEKNPHALGVPSEVYAHLLPDKRTKAQATTEKRQCVVCGTDLKPTLAKYCSGSCMLEDKNGQLSTP